ncbi:MAG: hypothetical protein E6Q24_04180 [Chitinophagaceae bacterium]|jgi:hypothetical protein|nr:MAG: hypothetical protein E6Q24_04180 [Chitinophagaceae bacterium]
MESFNEFQATLVVTYGVEGHEMNIGTLTSTINSLTNIFHRIDEIMSPEERSEFVIVAMEPGSFKINFKQLSKKVFENLAFAILGSFVWEKIHPSTPELPKSPIEVMGNKARLDINGRTYVMPVDSLANYEAVRKDRYINGQLVETFVKISNDQRIQYMSFSPSDKVKENPAIYISRAEFEKLANSIDQIKEDIFYQDEIMEILSLNKTDNVYQGKFLWKGKTIEASITDSNLKYMSSKYKEKLQPKKMINVRMKETKTNDYYTTELIHSRFEILQVYL